MYRCTHHLHRPLHNIYVSPQPPFASFQVTPVQNDMHVTPHGPGAPRRGAAGAPAGQSARGVPPGPTKPPALQAPGAAHNRPASSTVLCFCMGLAGRFSLPVVAAGTLLPGRDLGEFSCIGPLCACLYICARCAAPVLCSCPITALVYSCLLRCCTFVFHAQCTDLCTYN